MNPEPEQLGPFYRAGCEFIQLSQRSKVPPKGHHWREEELIYGAAEEWMESYSGNVGIRLKATQLVVDVDPRNFSPGNDAFERLQSDLGLRLDTGPRVISGGGGSHFYFTKPADIPVTDTLDDPLYYGVDFKSVGRYMVAAGSIHPDGPLYEWDQWAPPLNEAPEVPAKLLTLIRRPCRKATGGGEISPTQLEECLAYLDPAQPEHARHDDWLALLMAAHHGTGGEGRCEFIEWSARNPAWAHLSREVGRRWDSLHRQKDNAVTVATLYRAVYRAGGQVPGGDPAEDFKPVDSEEDAGDRESLFAQMNAKHACAMEGGRFWVFSWNVDPVMEPPRKFWQRTRKADFADEYANQQVEVGGGKTVPAGQAWLVHPRRRQYKGVIFDPDRHHEGYLNLWMGWAVEARRGNWCLLKDLIYEVLCDRDWYCFDYIMDWCAFMVQFPWRPAEVALVLKGPKGAGKGTFGRALLALAGDHGVQISSAEHLTGRFNNHMRNCIAILFDEMVWAGDKSGQGNLQRTITEPTLFFEPKGVDGAQGRNMLHPVILSDRNWVVPAGPGERRYAVMDVNAEAKGDFDRFDAVNAQLESGGLGAMLFELKTRDITGWHPRRGIPQTQALLSQKLLSMEPVWRWWHGLLQEGRLPGVGEWNGAAVTVYSQRLQEDLMARLKDDGTRNRQSVMTQLGIALKEFAPGHEKMRKVADEDDMVRTDGQGRAVVYVFPGLDECRDIFDRRLGGGLAW